MCFFIIVKLLRSLLLSKATFMWRLLLLLFCYGFNSNTRKNTKQQVGTELLHLRDATASGDKLQTSLGSCTFNHPILWRIHVVWFWRICIQELKKWEKFTQFSPLGFKDVACWLCAHVHCAQQKSIWSQVKPGFIPWDWVSIVINKPWSQKDNKSMTRFACFLFSMSIVC